MSLTLPPYEEPASTPGNVPWPPEGFKWTGDGGITDFQSYAWIIHNAVYERLSTSTFFSGFAIKRISEALPIEAGFQIPFLGIFEGDELMVPDGGLNQGAIAFAHTINLGVQVVIQDNNPATLLQRLDQAYWFIMNRLWRDDTFTNRIFTLMPGNVRFEGVARIRKKKKWGVNASRNETPVGILTLDIQLPIRTEFAPTEFADLEMITVTTAYPSVAEQAAVQQVKAVYVFTPQAKGATNGERAATNGERAATNSGAEPCGEDSSSAASPGAVEAD
jgi:hypothetical protein